MDKLDNIIIYTFALLPLIIINFLIFLYTCDTLYNKYKLYKHKKNRKKGNVISFESERALRGSKKK